MAMDFASAGAKVRRLIANKKPQQLQTSALTSDALRDNVIDEAIERTPRFQSHLNDAPVVEYEVTNEDGSTEQREYEWTAFPSAVRDVARAGWSYDEPEVASVDKVRPSHQFNRTIMNHYLGSDAFTESRPYTRENEPESLFQAMAAADSLVEDAPELLAEHIARSEQMREQEDAIQSADDLLDNLRSQALEEYKDAGQVDPNLVDQIKQASGQLKGARGTLADLIAQQQQSNMVQACAKAAVKAAEAGAEAAETLANLPGVGAGNAHNLPLDKQIELAERWSENEELVRLAREIGRTILDMTHRRTARVKGVPIRPVSVTTGNDVERLLPHEMARGFMPSLQPTFMRDFADRKLLQHEYEGDAPAGKGPVICVTDGSNSMTEDMGGVTRFVWASSLGVALLTIANREKRAFCGVEFGSAGEVKVWFFPAREAIDPDVLLDYATHFFDGGTDIETGMTAAAEVVRTHAPFKSADVVLVSDGEDSFGAGDAAIKRELEDLAVRIHGVEIAHSSSYLGSMCSHTVHVKDLASAREAQTTLAQNIT